VTAQANEEGTANAAGFVGRAAQRFPKLSSAWPGIFAVGDVRSGSVKRVAAAVGEGSACVQQVHQALGVVGFVVL